MGLDLNLVQGEIIGGSEKGSKHLVFAKSPDFKLAIRPLIFPSHRDDMEGAWMHCGFRLRVELINDYAELEDASDALNIPGLMVKGSHASVVAGMAVCTAPCSPSEMTEWMVKGEVAEKIVEDLASRLEKKGVPLVMDKELVKEYLKVEYEKLIPPTEVKGPKEYPIYWPTKHKKASTEDDE